MKTPRLIQDIQSQPGSLSDVLDHHSGAGRDTLQRAAALVSSAKRVIVTGMGASMFGCVPLEYQLCALGIPTFLIETAELLYYRQEICTDSIVIVVSRSGESVEVAKLMISLKGHVPIIGVSNNPASMVARNA